MIALRYSAASAVEVRRRSTVEVHSVCTFKCGKPVDNGLFDLYMGAFGEHPCSTCGLRASECTGHFGHIELAEPQYNPVFLPYILKQAREHCSCGAFRAGRICALCYTAQNSKETCCGKKRWSSRVCPACREEYPSFVLDGGNVLCNNKELSTAAFCALSRTTNEYVLHALPVPPMCARPSIVTVQNTIRSHDNLTIHLLEILKKNAALRKALLERQPEHYLKQCRAALREQLGMYMSNGSTRDSFKKNASSVGGIMDRLGGKIGRFRQNLMGKRCNFTARTVVGGDPSLGIEELGVPRSIAKTLTKPVRVCAYNIDALSKPFLLRCVYRGGKSGGRILGLGETPALQLGDVVDRYLRDGDWVLFNRQPSLHKMSLMAHRVRILPYSTFRLNLSVTTPYNADFDGDEMNLHVPQSLEATAELATLCRVREQIVSVTNNKPVIGIVQDTLLGAYLCTSSDVRFSEHDAMQHLMTQENVEAALARARAHRADSDRSDTMCAECGETRSGRALCCGKERWTTYFTGGQLLSVLLPPTLTVRIGDMEIRRGRLIRGAWDKRVLGTSSGSLPHVLCLDHGNRAAEDFLNGLQRLVCSIMKTMAFSAGFKDCILPPHALEKVETTKRTTRERYDASAANEDVANAVLNAARDSIGRLAVEHCEQGNSFAAMKSAGSKGSNINMAQIMGCVGQQNVQGKRIGWDSARTLPHFAVGSTDPASKGYIAHSYIEGVNPSEFFFHTMAGREGLVDTAVKTAKTGYLQRRIVKGMEDVVVEHDGTCRDREKVIQFEYGEDGYSAVAVEWQHVPCLRLNRESFDAMYVWQENAEEVRAVEAARDLFEYADQARGSNVQFETRFVLPCNIERTVCQHRDAAPPLSLRDRVTLRGSSMPLRDVHKLWPGAPLVRAFLTSALSSKRIVCTYKMSASALSNVVDVVFEKLRKARVDAKESVGALAAQSIGEPSTQLTLNSVDYETRLVVRWRCVGGVRNGSVGEMIDSLLQGNEEVQWPEAETAYLPLADGAAEALTVDSTGAVSWKALEAVTRHPPRNADGTNNLVKITTRSGRSVVATRAKSFLVWQDDAIEIKRGSDLVVGDRVPVVSELPREEEVLDLAHHLSPQQVFFTDTLAKGKPFRSAAEAAAALKIDCFQQAGMVIARPFSKSSVGAPQRIALSNSFGHFVGAFLAAGRCRGQWVHILHGERPRRAVQWAIDSGMQVKKRDEGSEVRCSALALLLNELCGAGNRKVVPSFALSAPKAFVEGLLEAFLTSASKRYAVGSYAVGLRSKHLLEGLQLLLATCGTNTVQGVWEVEGAPLYGLRVASKKRKRCLRGDPITCIECCPSTHEYVYDLTVAGTRNMVTASGLAVRDTFHNTGVSSKTSVTLGVPRLNELVNCSKTIKTPSMTLFFPPGTSFEQAMWHKSRLVPTRLASLLLDSSIAYEHPVAFPLHADFPDPNEGSWSELSLQLRFDRDACIRGHLGVAQLADAVYQFLPKCHLEYSEDSDLTYALNVHVASNVARSEHAWQDDNYELLHKHSMRLRSCGVGGLPGIDAGHLSQESRRSYHEHMLHTESEWVLTTQGTCLGRALAEHRRLDGARCYSNHVHDVLAVLGIEAARASLLNEIRGILSFDGSYVNARHMGLAVDWMTFTGQFTAFTRYGMANMTDSVLKLSSFERPKHFLVEGAHNNSTDTFGGVSEQLVMGLLPRMGTGSVECRLDEEKAKGFFVQPAEPELTLTLELPEWKPDLQPFAQPAAFAPPSPLYCPPSPLYCPGEEEAYAPSSP